MGKKKPLLYFYQARPLTGEYAFMTAEFLENVVRMLWREYADDMADFQGRVFPEEPSSQYERLFCTNKGRTKHDDDNF